MKQLLSILLFLLCTTACSKDDENNSPELPITGLELPSADESIEAGQTVTIKGKGFTAASEIWFRSTVTRAIGSSEIKAEIANVTDAWISFLAPATAGKYGIILKQDGNSFDLGTLSFSEPKEPKATHIFTLVDIDTNGREGVSEFYEYNLDDTFTKIITLKGGVWKSVLAGENGIVYYFRDDAEACGLFRFDLKTKTENFINHDWLAKADERKTGQAIGIIDGTLHGVKYSQKDGFTLLQIADNGTETEIKKFPTFQTPGATTPADFYCEDDNLIFAYDEINKAVLLTGGVNIDDASNYDATVSLNVQTGEVKTLLSKDVDWYQCVSGNGKTWLFTETETYVEGGKTKYDQTVSLINSLTLKEEQSIKDFADYLVYRPTYSKVQNRIYWIGDDTDNKFLWYDVATKKISASKGTMPNIDNIFVATY